jgi:hypothetical protein
MFLKSPRKFTFASLTFALVLSTNLLFSGESFAVGPQEYFNEALVSFNQALKEESDQKRKKLLGFAQNIFGVAYEKFTENRAEQEELKNRAGQAESKLFWARTNALISGPIHATYLFDEAVEHYRIAEKDAPIKDGLADALFYQAENKLQIELIKIGDANKSSAYSDSHKAKLIHAKRMHTEAKACLEESLNLPQTPELKIRTGGKLAFILDKDQDNQKAKDALLKIVNVMSDPSLRAGTQQEIIDYCLELEGKTNDINYQNAKDALVKIVDEIEDVKFKAETQKRIGEFFYVVKDLPNTISYLTKARDYFGTNTSWIGYAPINAKAVGEINTILQHAKYLTGLYKQSVEDGLAAEQWIKTSIQSSEDLQDKEKFSRKLLSNLHLLGNAYLKLYENDSKLNNINNAESTFNTLDDLINLLLANAEENSDISQSMFLNPDSIKKLSENSDYVDFLYAYQIRSNIGLTYTNIQRKLYSAAGKNLDTAERTIKLLNDVNSENIVKRVTRAELAIDMARLNLRMFETKTKTSEERSSKLKGLSDEWSSVSVERIASYYAPRHLWNLEMTLGDASFHMNDIEAAKKHYIAAITEARKAGYKHFEMLARNQLALMLDTNLKAESEALVSLESEFKTLNTEKATLVKEAAVLKKAKSDQEESKNAEIEAKEAVIKEKEAPIAALKATIAGFTSNRNRESGIADNLKLFCELRTRGYFESNVAYSEDEQKLYLTYLGELPAFNVDPSLNSSQIVDNYDAEVKPVAASDNNPKENLDKVVEELKETLVLPDELSALKEEVVSNPVEETQLDEIFSEDILSQEPAQPLDLLAGNIFDASEEESDEVDENSAKMTDFLNQLVEVHEKKSTDLNEELAEVYAELPSDDLNETAKLTDDFPDLTSLELWASQQSDLESEKPSVLRESLPPVEDLGLYLDIGNVQSATVLGAPFKKNTEHKASKINHAPAMQRIIDKKRWNPKKKTNRR